MKAALREASSFPVPPIPWWVGIRDRSLVENKRKSKDSRIYQHGGGRPKFDQLKRVHKGS